MPIHRLEQLENLRPGYVKLFEVEGRPIVLACGERGPAVVDAICPHAGANLGGGEIVGHRIRCPNHRFLFDLDTGDCARGRREGWGPLKTYAIQVVDGDVCVEL
jgi:nitrite reductase/ring-hydroxylating ferredoxin subunit